MSPPRYYVRASGDANLIAAVAATLREKWDPAGEFFAPDGTSTANSHAATVLAMLSTGGDLALVKGYLRRAEEAAMGTARSSSRERGDLAETIFQMMLDVAIQASMAVGSNAPAT